MHPSRRPVVATACLALPLLLQVDPQAAQAGGVTVEFAGTIAPAVTQRVTAAGVIAGDFQFNSITTAMRFVPGVGRVPLPVPVGTTQSIATGINEAGVIVGRYSAGAGTFGAIWSVGDQLTTLPSPPGTWSYSTPSNISETGVVCGFATLAQVGVDPEQAWRWTPVTAKQQGGYEMLPRLGGVVAVCRDINSAGQVIGHGSLANGLFRACIWGADGTPALLPLPSGATQSYGYAINESGAACGTTPGNEIPWVWTPTQGTRVLPDFGFKAAAYDINASGWILGWADKAPFETVPVVWDPQGNLHDISALTDPTRFYHLGDFAVPIAISDANLIVVRGYDFTVSGDPLVLMFRVLGPSACPTDLGGDGVTGPQDLAQLLSAWGGAGTAGEDLDGNGVVGAQDIAVMLSAWGVCP